MQEIYEKVRTIEREMAGSAGVPRAEYGTLQ